MRGYCMGCGMNRELDGLLCRQCADDALVSARRGRAACDFPLTLDGLICHARTLQTRMAEMFLVAVQDALMNGSLYGWD